MSWSGKAYTWGWGHQGILGHGSDADVWKPTRVAIPHIDVSGGSDGGDAWDRSGGGGVVVVEDPVTCAAARLSCTVLGTRHGRVLSSGVVALYFADATESAVFVEFGRLGGGLRCWRVQCESLPDYCNTTLVMAIDPDGQVYEVEAINVMAWGEDSSKYGNPSKQRVAISPGYTPCSSVVLSPSQHADRRRCWWETGGAVGGLEWGVNFTFTMGGVSREGRLLISSEVISRGTTLSYSDENDAGEERRSVGVGVVHASAWIGDSCGRSHGLRLEDGGTSVLTWGDGRTGHVSGDGW